jgi:hypothetical protein
MRALTHVRLVKVSKSYRRKRLGNFLEVVLIEICHLNESDSILHARLKTKQKDKQS